MGIGSTKIRLAVWIPAHQPNIVRYLTAVRELVSDSIEIEIFCTSTGDSASLAPATAVLPADSFIQRHTEQPFDLHVYHIAGDPYTDEPVYQQFLKQTGIVVLHERNMLPLYVELLLGRGYQVALLDEVEYNYGLDTRNSVQEAIVNGISLGAIEPKLELTRRVVERALALSVHRPEDYTALVERYPHKQIVYTPLSLTPQVNRYISYESVAQTYRELVQLLLFSPSSTPWAKSIAKRRRATGVNFLADFKVSAGLGVAAMSLFDATLESGIPVAFTEVQHNFWRRTTAMSPRYQGLSRGLVYPVNVLCTNIHELHQVTPAELADLKGGKYTVASWFWELSEIPNSYLPEFERIDEIWVASRYTQEAMLTVAKVPVHVIPCAVEVKTSPKIDRAAFGIPTDRFVFFFSFSAVSCSARKNPWGVIEAFERAFGGNGTKQPLLVIKSHHIDLLPEFQAALHEALDRIGGMLIEGDYTRQQTNDLLACADAYISLHRAEGFGLGMAESMYLGKPVIGTAYSANTDFMTADNSYLVDYYIRPVTPYDHRYQTECLAVYEPGQIWAEPDVEMAAFWMRHIYENQQDAIKRGRRAATDIRRYCGPEAVGRAVEQRLIEIEAQNPLRISLSHVREAAYASQHRHRERYKYWADTFEQVEAPPSTDKPFGRAAAPYIKRSKSLRFLSRTYKRLRWLGYTLANQHELNRASVEVIDALTDALVSADASLPTLQATITELQNKVARIEQPQADADRERIRACAEVRRLSGQENLPEQEVTTLLDAETSR